MKIFDLVILSTRLTLISYNLRCLHVLFLKSNILWYKNNNKVKEFRFYRESLIERSDSLKRWKQNDSFVLKHFVSFWRFYSQTLKMQLCSFNADCFWWTSSLTLRHSVVSVVPTLQQTTWVIVSGLGASWRHAELVCVHVFPPGCWTGQTLLCFNVLLIYKRWFQVWNDPHSVWRLVRSQLVVMKWSLFLWSFSLSWSCFTLPSHVRLQLGIV